MPYIINLNASVIEFTFFKACNAYLKEGKISFNKIVISEFYSFRSKSLEVKGNIHFYLISLN